MADVAAQVVAWHNRHPLARRIARKDVQGIGIIALPFARPAQPAWNAVTPKRGLLALMFPKRVDRRPWPAFSEDALPDIGVARLAEFALKRGWIERPGPGDQPERALQVDRDLLDTPRGRPAADQPAERLDRYLVTAAIDLGPTRPRLVLGRGRRMPVLGQRLWSLPRIAALGGALLLAVVVGVAGLWVAATSRPGPDTARAGAAGASAAASTPSSPRARSVPVQPALAASVPTHQAAPTPTLPPSAAASAITAPAQPTSAAAAAAPAGPTPAASTPIAVGPRAAGASAVAAPATPAPPATAPAPMPGASPPAAAPPSAVVQRASAPLVPSLRPDLAASARAEASRHPDLPSRPPGASTAGAALPRDAASAARGATRFYALVSRPLRSEAEADALLKRLRAETQRIAHPTAIETGLQRTPEGWRVTWWPFTHPRQAENARAALAARRVDLEMVEF